MFPKLHKNYQFRYVYRHGKTLTDRMLLVTFCPAARKVTQIGCSVSKKNGNAVLRNRIKRLMRESARALYPRIQPGYSLVISAATKYDFGAGVSYADVYHALEGLLQRAGLLESTTAD